MPRQLGRYTQLVANGRHRAYRRVSPPFPLLHDGAKVKGSVTQSVVHGWTTGVAALSYSFPLIWASRSQARRQPASSLSPRPSLGSSQGRTFHRGRGAWTAPRRVRAGVLARGHRGLEQLDADHLTVPQPPAEPARPEARLFVSRIIHHTLSVDAVAEMSNARRSDYKESLKF